MNVYNCSEGIGFVKKNKKELVFLGINKNSADYFSTFLKNDTHHNKSKEERILISTMNDVEVSHTTN